MPVLLVNDHAYLRDALATFLAVNGLEVVVAEHGQEALDQLRGGLRPSVILLDLAMPVMDGATFRKQQLEDSELAAIPVVIVSVSYWQHP